MVGTFHGGVTEENRQTEGQLAEYQQYPMLSDGEDYILRATEALSMLLALCVTMLAVVLLLGWA